MTRPARPRLTASGYALLLTDLLRRLHWHLEVVGGWPPVDARDRDDVAAAVERVLEVSAESGRQVPWCRVSGCRCRELLDSRRTDPPRSAGTVLVG